MNQWKPVIIGFIFLIFFSIAIPFNKVFAESPALDFISVGTPQIAYSLRKVKSNYNGSAIRVRRSSDNTELDIGFDSNGNLDTSALLSFVGSSKGYVSIWYDQSGNARNATQTTTTRQPRIVNSGGVIDVTNGRPTLYSESTDVRLTGTLNINSTTGLSIHTVGKSPFAGVDDDAAPNFIAWAETGSWGQTYVGNNQSRIHWRFGTSQTNNRRESAHSMGSNPHIISIKHFLTNETAFIDGVSKGTVTGLVSSLLNNSTDFRLMSSYWSTSGTSIIGMGLQEVFVIFGSVTDTDRLRMEQSQGLYYSISTPTNAPTAPTSLSATASGTSVNLSWTSPDSNGGSALTDYLVEYKTSAGSTWGTFTDGVSTGTTATVTGLTNGTSYDFRVSAINSIGTSTASSTATGTVSNTSTRIGLDSQPLVPNGAVPLIFLQNLNNNNSSNIKPTTKPAIVRGDGSNNVKFKIIKSGSTGIEVMEVQKILIKNRLLGGRPTGVYNKATRDAIIQFQRKNKIKADGVVGRATWNKLFGF